jgi:hypothetical protein
VLSCAPVLAATASAKPAQGGVSRVAQCSWDRPGHDPFMGDVVAAVDHYADIPADVRVRLKERMARRDYDDIAIIRRDSISGSQDYDPTIRDMHFGTNRMCTGVVRTAWTPTQEERGLVYCEGGQCLIVPTVCRNVSRIRRVPRQAVAAATAEAPAAPEDELVFPPPGAGPPATDAAAPDGGLPSAAPTSFADGSGPLLAGPPLIVGGFPTIPGGGGGGGGGGHLPSGPIAAVVEPSTWALMFFGMLMIGWRVRASARHCGPDSKAVAVDARHAA